jgi:hypothetical protein
MPFLELTAYLDQKAAQYLHEAGDHTGLASPRLHHKSILLYFFDTFPLTVFT